MDWEEWRAEVQRRSGMSDARMLEIEDNARGAFLAGIPAATYADLGD